MGDISEHWSKRDFACRCPECQGEYRVHMGLVGALEMIGEKFRKKTKILSAFWCDDFFEKLGRGKRSYHCMGKAAHIAIDGVTPQDLFKFCETIPELRGMVFYPKEAFIHVDTRPGDTVRLVKEGAAYLPLTDENRAKYGL
ncbi:MAG: D-Ala-D-Ala carboxypeptidase family metallohydrolase [Candidatus Margulisiibacteriota bacterium]